DLFYEMAEILALLLSVGLLFTAYKMGHGLFEPAKAKIILLFLNGPFSQSFWLFEITIGFVLPILILLYAARRRKIAGVLGASIMVLAGTLSLPARHIRSSKNSNPFCHIGRLLWRCF
ncbi:MAG: polysulfide reductase NrfD, partial [Deltaproteobacteria bacterium]|nr:polysulfide reductase NrfD [Deltaproteobacteria bacterium]